MIKFSQIGLALLEDEPFRCLEKMPQLNSPKLGALTQLIGRLPGYQKLLKELQLKTGANVVALDAARPYLAAALYENLRVPILLVTAQPEHARALCDQLSSWSNAGRVMLFPEPDVLPYERVTPDSSTGLERIQALNALAGIGKNGEVPPIIVASAAALISRTTPYKDFTSTCHTVKLGMTTEPFKLLADWEKMGYRLENVVELPGTVSHRGGIVDIFPTAAQFPVRLEFFGDSIDSIRSLDPATQRSITNVASINVCTASELLAPWRLDNASLEDLLNSLNLTSLNTETKELFRQDKEMFLTWTLTRDAQYYTPLFNSGKILDYLPQEGLLILDEPATIAQVIAELDAEAVQLRSEKIDRGELPVNFPVPYFTWDVLEAEIEKRHPVKIEAWE